MEEDYSYRKENRILCGITEFSDRDRSRMHDQQVWRSNQMVNYSSPTIRLTIGGNRTPWL